MKKELKASILMFLAAIIWGFAFVAQRVGVDYVGPFTFNGIRFALGSISLIPVILLFNNKVKKESGQIGTAAEDVAANQDEAANKKVFKSMIVAGLILGSVLFCGAALQQMGLKYTTAGKAAFITGFYIVLVPVFGAFLGQKICKSTWLAVALSIVGLYLISVTEDFTISKGDVLQLIGSVFWTVHILLIHRFTQKYDAIKLSFIQFAVCSILSLSFGLILETITLAGLLQALVPLLYGGFASVGIAYTLQAYGQTYAKPSHAAIILSMETVFAALGGYLILREVMSLRGYFGCILMLSAVILSQLDSLNTRKTSKLQTRVEL